MKNNHLTDETLQAFLLKETQEESIAAHLSTCADCQAKLESYQALVFGIQKTTPETFSFDVTSLVMQKIIAVEAQKEKNANLVLYMSWAIVSIVATAILYPYINIIFTPFKSYSIMGTVFMFISALGVIVFLLNDLFRQYKQKEMLLLQ